MGASTPLTAEERGLIMAAHQRGSSGAAIVRLLGRSRSTISRELRRNSTGASYVASVAASAYRERRRRCVRPRKLVQGSWLFSFVRDRLIYRCWSPQQIAATLVRMHPADPSRHVSHETIYAAIYAHPKGALRIPEEIEERLLPGHWEGDFMKGAFNRSAVGTLVERKSRFVVLCKMKDCSAEAALESFTRQMQRLPAFLRQSLAYDRGSEMARHEELAERLKLTIYFADPYAPWQRGSNENANGLLRQFMPKGTDLSVLSQTQLNDIARLLNSRPRETLDWHTPEEVISKEISNFHNRVALEG